MITVTLTACTSGNPLKGWSGTPDPETGLLPEAPDDVWEDVSYDFGDDLDAAKEYVRGLHPQMVTHVKMLADGVVFFDQDAGADHLDDAAPDVVMPHTVDFGGPPGAAEPQEPPPPFQPPGGTA